MTRLELLQELKDYVTQIYHSEKFPHVDTVNEWKVMSEKIQAGLKELGCADQEWLDNEYRIWYGAQTKFKDKIAAFKEMMAKMNTETELKGILDTMNVPEMRKSEFNDSNLRWFLRNLIIQNGGNQGFDRAIVLIKELRKTK